MIEELKAFENAAPEIVFYWKDKLTEAEGWTVINSLRNGSAGGGTRMRKGLQMNEVLSLAKTMEVKFSVCGPPIGGAKSGINFDPEDPRKEGVLGRWYAAVFPLLKTYYGTGGDLNVDEIREVLPITAALGLLHCQEGTVNGYYGKNDSRKEERIRRLQVGVSKKVMHPTYTPDVNGFFTVADLITGWGVAEAALAHYQLLGQNYAGKKVAVQGFGNVGGAAAWYLSRAGMQVVGITDASGGLFQPEGISTEKLAQLMIDRKGNEFSDSAKVNSNIAEDQIYSCGAQVFLPCAKSRMISKANMDQLLTNGLEVISSGANVPFDDPEIFLGPTGIYADEKTASIPDFIANCGMARTFAYLMGSEGPLSDEGIFEDVKQTIHQAMAPLYKNQTVARGLWQAGLKIELTKLNEKQPALSH